MKNNSNGPDGFLSGDPLSDDRAKQESPSMLPWIVAGSVVVLIVVALIVFNGKPRTDPATLSSAGDAYASQLTIADVALSQTSNIAGSQITYVDGTVTNHGQQTVHGITVQVTFHVPGEGAAGFHAQVETSPLNLIRMRVPYVDIGPVSADPIQPGQSKPFRLIFEHVSPDWNQQAPDIQVVHVTLQ